MVKEITRKELKAKLERCSWRWSGGYAFLLLAPQ